MGQASLMSQVLPQDDGNRFRMPDLPPAGGMGVDYGYTPNGMAIPSSMGMPAMNLQAPEFGIVDPTYLAQLAILNQGGGSYMPAAPAAPMGLLGAGLDSQDQFRANAPLLGGAPAIADWRAYSPNRSANADLNRAIAMSQGGGDGSMGSGGGGGGFSGRGIGADDFAFGVLGATSGPLGYAIPGGLLANLAAGQYLDARIDYIGKNDFGTLGNVPGGMGTFSDQYGNVGTFSSPATIAAQDAAIFGGATDTGYSGVGGGSVGSINNSMSQSDMLSAQDAGMTGTNDGTYCCSRMVDLDLWSEHKHLARMHVWHHKQAKWWRAGYSVWGKVVANTLFKKKGFWTDVMDDFYSYHVKNKPRTLKSTVGDLVIYPGVAVCSLFVQEAPATTRYVAQ